LYHTSLYAAHHALHRSHCANAARGTSCDVLAIISWRQQRRTPVFVAAPDVRLMRAKPSAATVSILTTARRSRCSARRCIAAATATSCHARHRRHCDSRSHENVRTTDLARLSPHLIAPTKASFSVEECRCDRVATVMRVGTRAASSRTLRRGTHVRMDAAASSELRAGTRVTLQRRPQRQRTVRYGEQSMQRRRTPVAVSRRPPLPPS
jgi:hypothetical protein